MSVKGILGKAGVSLKNYGALTNWTLKGNMYARNIPKEFIGDYFYVDSVTGSDASGYGYRKDKPTATIDYAIGLCTANAGDVIWVLPGHTETLSAATSCVLDVAGVTIIGLGTGLLRPTLTWATAATATFSITAASCKVCNILCISNFTNGITTGITVGASADGLILEDIEMQETANTKEWLIGISIAAACHNVTINGFKYYGLAGGTTSQVIKFLGASNYSVVKNFLIFCDASGAAIDALTAASVWMTFGCGVLHNLDTAAGLSISVKSDTTGFMHDLRISQLKDTIGPAGAAMAASEVYSSNAIFTQGILKPVADS